MNDPALASMHPTELRATMARMNLSTQTELAKTIGVDRSTVSLWLDGRIGVPRPVAKLLRILSDAEAAPSYPGCPDCPARHSAPDVACRARQ